MRLSLLIFILAAVSPAFADEVTVAIHSARPYGYFVGDLIRAHVDVSAPADSTLSMASLPRPGPLTSSLDLKDVAVRETSAGGMKIWRLDLTYQNFYVALDVRNIEIPAFELSVATSAGLETVSVPAWEVGVAPLREIAPARKEQAEDYLRPDAPVAFVDEARPRYLALALGAAALLSLAAMARDRGWPPFQRRKARIFSVLARRLTAQARGSCDEEGVSLAFRSVHRAIDAAYGASLLADNLSSFLDRRPEFASLRPSFEQFFEASHRRFFGDGVENVGFDIGDLARFAQALAQQERAG